MCHCEEYSTEGSSRNFWILRAEYLPQNDGTGFYLDRRALWGTKVARNDGYIDLKGVLCIIA